MAEAPLKGAGQGRRGRQRETWNKTLLDVHWRDGHIGLADFTVLTDLQVCIMLGLKIWLHHVDFLLWAPLIWSVRVSTSHSAVAASLICSQCCREQWQ